MKQLLKYAMMSDVTVPIVPSKRYDEGDIKITENRLFSRIFTKIYFLGGISTVLGGFCGHFGRVQ